MRSSFSKKNLEEFMTKLVSGRESLVKYQELPKIRKVAEWDGKDKKPEIHDDEEL